MYTRHMFRPNVLVWNGPNPVYLCSHLAAVVVIECGGCKFALSARLARLNSLELLVVGSQGPNNKLGEIDSGT